MIRPFTCKYALYPFGVVANCLLINKPADCLTRKPDTGVISYLLDPDTFSIELTLLPRIGPGMTLDSSGAIDEFK